MTLREKDGKRCAVYVRVWSGEDQQEPSWALQVEACMRKARALGFRDSDVEVVEDCDPGTGTIRPGLDKVRSEVAEGEVSAVVVYDPEVLAQGMGNQLLLVDEIEGDGAKVRFAREGFEESPEGRLFYLTREFLTEYRERKRGIRSTHRRAGKKGRRIR